MWLVLRRMGVGGAHSASPSGLRQPPSVLTQSAFFVRAMFLGPWAEAHGASSALQWVGTSAHKMKRIEHATLGQTTEVQTDVLSPRQRTQSDHGAAVPVSVFKKPIHVSHHR